jgi:hypothetical protein
MHIILVIELKKIELIVFFDKKFELIVKDIKVWKISSFNFNEGNASKKKISMKESNTNINSEKKICSTPFLE